MLKHISYLFFVFALILASVGCSPYQKVLNGTDVAEKYKEAERYYQEGEYKKANRLFEQVLPSYRGKPQAQRVVFFYANTYFETKNYYLAAYQFESFLKSFPKSDRTDEATFMEAKSYYMLSPEYSLDQANTIEAMDKLQIFIDNYPNSSFLSEANGYVQELQTKLEKKDFEIAKQYHTIRDYRAAIRALDNFIIGFPGTPFREDALYYKFLSAYEIATNSITSKKLSRLNDLKIIQETLLRYYPETLYLDDLEKKMKRVSKEITLLEKNT